MSEQYVECMVKAQNNPLIKVAQIVCGVLAAAAFVLTLVTGIGVLFFLALLFGAGVYAASLFSNPEYEYLYIDKSITVDVIYNQQRRKRVAVFELDKIQVFAPIHSYHLEQFGKPTAKPVDYSIGFEDKPDRRYIMYYEGMKTYLFSPNEEMVKMMKNVAPRKVFND